MNAPPIVYLGPTLPLPEAQHLLAAEYRPPVRRGDLPTGCDGRLLVIIDGEFGQSLSVSPKEILRLLDQGTRVFGASSMGALRAAELYPFGMQGFGWVYQGYRSGRIIGDDELAVSYSPFNGQPLTIPLVNVRCWLERLRSTAVIDPVAARRMFRGARKIFFADRTFQRLQVALEGVIGAALLRRLVRTAEDITDIKAEDAREVLTHVASLLHSN